MLAIIGEIFDILKPFIIFAAIIIGIIIGTVFLFALISTLIDRKKPKYNRKSTNINWVGTQYTVSDDIELNGKQYIDYGDESAAYFVMEFKKNVNIYQMNTFMCTYDSYLCEFKKDSYETDIYLERLGVNKYRYKDFRQSYNYLFVLDNYIITSDRQNVEVVPPEQFQKRHFRIHFPAKWYYRLVETKISDYMESPHYRKITTDYEKLPNKTPVRDKPTNKKEYIDTSKIILNISYTCALPPIKLYGELKQKYINERKFYNTTAEYNVLSHMQNNAKVCKDRNENTGLFNSKGLLFKEDIEELKERLAKTKSIIWHGFLSFDDELSTRIQTQAAAIKFLNQSFNDFIERTHLDRNNIELFAALHTNATNHRIHFCFFEKFPKHRNKNGKLFYTYNGSIDNAAINDYLNTFNKQTSNKKDYISTKITPISELSKNESDMILETVTTIDSGTEAERNIVLKLLKSGLHRKLIYHDLYLETQDGNFSQIDLVVLTCVGIIVFESKDYNGEISGDGNRRKWTQIIENERRYKFYNPILQNNRHIEQLQKQFNTDVPFYSVIVFSGNCKIKVSKIPSDTCVIYEHQISHTVKEIIENNSPVNYSNMPSIVTILKKAAQNGKNPEIQIQHIKYVDEVKSRLEAN